MSDYELEFHPIGASPERRNHRKSALLPIRNECKADGLAEHFATPNFFDYLRRNLPALAISVPDDGESLNRTAQSDRTKRARGQNRTAGTGGRKRGQSPPASSQKGRALTLCHCPEQAPFNAAWSAPNSLMWVVHLRLIEPGEEPMIRSTQSPFSVWLRFPPSAPSPLLALARCASAFA